MSELAIRSTPTAAAGRPNLEDTPHAATLPVFLLLLVAGLGYAIYGLLSDMNSVGESRWRSAPSSCSAWRC